MTTKIINKDNDNLLIEWQDENKGFGQLSMMWNDATGRFILDSEHMGVDTILEIFKAI